jgi:hypothetical protein
MSMAEIMYISKHMGLGDGGIEMTNKVLSILLTSGRGALAFSPQSPPYIIMCYTKSGLSSEIKRKTNMMTTKEEEVGCVGGHVFVFIDILRASTKIHCPND